MPSLLIFDDLFTVLFQDLNSVLIALSISKLFWGVPDVFFVVFSRLHGSFLGH